MFNFNMQRISFNERTIIAYSLKWAKKWELKKNLSLCPCFEHKITVSFKCNTVLFFYLYKGKLDKRNRGGHNFP